MWQGSEPLTTLEFFGSNATKYRINFDRAFAKDIPGHSDLETSLWWMHGHEFLTYDADDGYYKCGRTYSAGWWYEDDSSYCAEQNLNGLYLPATESGRQSDMGITWYTFKGDYYSLKKTVMKIAKHEGNCEVVAREN
jgi:hypothetical protein